MGRTLLILALIVLFLVALYIFMGVDPTPADAALVVPAYEFGVFGQHDN